MDITKKQFNKLLEKFVRVVRMSKCCSNNKILSSAITQKEGFLLFPV